MAKFSIEGGNKLHGQVSPVGNKNAVLKMIPATLLSSEPITLTNVPAISDVRFLLRIMEEIGTNITYHNKGETITLHTPEIKSSKINFEEAKKLRASNVFLGPLLARTGEVTSVLPGGDKIGPREMNAHFDGFRQLGAEITINEDDSFTIKGKLKGSHVFLYEPSVTATENIILASAIATGETIISNAACEPHVQELCLMLESMGADISGIGTNKLIIRGVKQLHGTNYVVPPDFIYIGTMIVLAAVTNGEISITNVNFEDLKNILYFFEKLGVKTTRNGNNLLISGNQLMQVADKEWARVKGVYSQPWPCFPTDMMSMAIVLSTQVSGSVLFFEKMYPGRMFFADYLNGMGANIIIADPHRIVVNGKTKLKGRKLFAPDLRAGMAYVAAGLCAVGNTIVENIEHIDRGYPEMEQILTGLGAKIKRIE